jgi:hypothetical protein
MYSMYTLHIKSLSRLIFTQWVGVAVTLQACMWEVYIRIAVGTPVTMTEAFLDFFRPSRKVPL